MSVTRRFALLAGLGIPILLLAALLAPISGFVPAIIFWLYNLVIFGLLVMDFVLSPNPSLLNISRIDEDLRYGSKDAIKLSHRARNRISFRVHNPSPYRINVQATDTVTHRHFEVSEEDLSGTIAPDEEKTFAYSVVPSKRGAYVFTHIHLKVRGLLGLAVKYHSHPCPMEFKVYPNLKDLGRYRIMMQKNRLLPRGDKSVRMFGQGTEFESLRAYVEGDDYRKINWPVTAREMRLIVNDYQAEKNQPVFMLIDGGRPMSYSVRGYKKLDYAINAALVLSDIVNQKGDQSGLLVFDKEVRSLIMPGKGEAHRNNLMEALYHIEETRDTPNYQAAFRLLCQKQKRRSMVFIFTDFETLEEAQELTAHMAALKRKHFVIVVFMKNDRLISLSENEDEYIREVAESFCQERKQLFRTLNAMAIPNIETEAEKFSTAAVNQYLALRKV